MLVLPLSACSFGGGDAEAQRSSRPHVVLLVLDEFPGDTLLGPNGRIDAGRFPNFAALAGDATWFRNAHTTYDSTTKAVPLILDGIRPRRGTAPIARDHPHSIFTALGRRGYRIVSSEEATAMCPRRYCPGERTKRPAIVPNLKGGRAERFGRFIRSIQASTHPTFWMKHALLPHGPWIYLPSGHRSRPEGPELLPGMQTVPGFYDDYVTDHNEQRYLLQLGFVDRLLGRLMARLRSEGMYDDTLIMVTADHGFAWQVGVPTRRSVDRSNVNELGPVPLFVKAPGQTRARVNDALAQTLDVTPTIADVLGVPLGYRTDGRSAFSRAVRARREVSLTTRDFSSIIRMSARRWKAQRRAVVRRRLRAARLRRLGEPLHEPRAQSRPHRTGRDRRAQLGRHARDDLVLACVRARATFERRRAVPGRGPDTRPRSDAGARPGDRGEWPNRGGWAKLSPPGRNCGELLSHGSGGCSAQGPQQGGGARGNR